MDRSARVRGSEELLVPCTVATARPRTRGAPAALRDPVPACYPLPPLLEQVLAPSSPVCPFCKGAVAADTLRFGGNCPHCMLEIPGEEAPTDPGLQARQRQEEEAKVRLAAQKKKNRAVGLVAVLALVVVAGGGAYAWQAQQAAMTYTMEDYYELELEDMSGPPAQQAAGADPATPATPGTNAPAKVASNGRKPAGQPQGASQGSEAGVLGTKRASDAGPEGDAALATGPSTALPSSSLGASAIKVSQVGTDVVLKDDQQIYDMAKRVINVSNGQVQNCYNQRLKAVPTLQGAWDVSFVIAKDGGVKSVKASPVNEKDAELEECIVRAVGSWKFQRISRDQPIKKTYRFGASGW